MLRRGGGNGGSGGGGGGAAAGGGAAQGWGRTSITKIFTKSSPFCASASAQPLPQMPTHTLRTTLAHTCLGRECVQATDTGRQVRPSEPRRHP